MTHFEAEALAALPRSATGAPLVDGLPLFAFLDGVPMHRRQWLAATKADRKAALVDALRADSEESSADAFEGAESDGPPETPDSLRSPERPPEGS